MSKQNIYFLLFGLSLLQGCHAQSVSHSCEIAELSIYRKIHPSGVGWERRSCGSQDFILGLRKELISFKDSVEKSNNVVNGTGFFTQTIFNADPKIRTDSWEVCIQGQLREIEGIIIEYLDFTTRGKHSVWSSLNNPTDIELPNALRVFDVYLANSDYEISIYVLRTMQDGVLALRIDCVSIL